ncbi:hypothetical protein PENSPDRAFT_754290, partial [Peniophora sp. CONT]
MGLLDYFPSFQLPIDIMGSDIGTVRNTPVTSNLKDAYLLDDAPMPELKMLPRWHHRESPTDAPMSDEELMHLRFKHSQGDRLGFEWALELFILSLVISLISMLPRSKDEVVLRSQNVALYYSVLGCYYTLFLCRRFSSGESGMRNLLDFMTGMRTSRFLTALARLPLFFAVSSLVLCVAHIVIRLYVSTLKD